MAAVAVVAAVARPNVRAALLALLTERPMHGYEMIQELDQRTGGAWRPSPGSVYPTLQLLEDEGLIATASEGGRKQFTLTEAGQVEAAQAARGAAVDRVRGRDDRQLAGDPRGGHQAMHALAQVMRNGTDEQRARAGEVLDEARRKLYAILAESESTSGCPGGSLPGSNAPFVAPTGRPHSGEDEPAGAASRV